MWILVGIGVLFVVMGLLVHKGKMYFLISGYNTMNKEKKAKVDVVGLGRYMGIHFYINGGIITVAGILGLLGIPELATPAMIFFAITTIIFLIRAQKFDGNIYDKQGKMHPGAWKQFLAPGIILTITLIFVAGLLYFSSRPTSIIMQEDKFVIEGMYGNDYVYDDIQSITLLDTLPTIKMRTNGSALGSHLRGRFQMEKYGKVTLFVDTKKAPFVVVQSSEGVTIFNLDDAEATLLAYVQLEEKINNN